MTNRVETEARDATKYDTCLAVPGCGKAANRWLLRWALFISCSIVLPACSIKAYPGPEMPDEHLSTISLPSGLALSWFPLFWFSPFDWLLPKDWIASRTAQFTIDNRSLGRFETLSLLPGRHSARARRIKTTDKTSLGPRQCGTPFVSYSKDKDGKRNCTRTTTCYDSFRVTREELECIMDFRTDPGRAYEIHIAADDSLVVTEVDTGHVVSSEDCFWTEPYTENVEEQHTVTDSYCE